MDRIINDYYSRSPIPLTAPAGWITPTLDGAVINGACASSVSTHRKLTSCGGGGICGNNSNP